MTQALKQQIFIIPHVSLFLCLIYLSVCLPVCLSACLSVCPLIYLVLSLFVFSRVFPFCFNFQKSNINFLGYEGKNCLIDINECASNPCQNQGVCVEPEVNMYRCNCQPGYTGINCEVDINECLSQPCEPFQVCKDFVNGYRWARQFYFNRI